MILLPVLLRLWERLNEWLFNDAKKDDKPIVYEECPNCGFKRIDPEGFTVWARQGDREFCNRCFHSREDKK